MQLLQVVQAVEGKRVEGSGSAAECGGSLSELLGKLRAGGEYVCCFGIVEALKEQ